jgi:hypothetical protein
MQRRGGACESGPFGSFKAPRRSRRVILYMGYPPVDDFYGVSGEQVKLSRTVHTVLPASGFFVGFSRISSLNRELFTNRTQHFPKHRTVLCSCCMPRSHCCTACDDATKPLTPAITCSPTRLASSVLSRAPVEKLIKGDLIMKTSEEARDSGLYASACCGEELLFGKGDTLWRCPQCQHLCDWELVQIAGFHS